MILKAELRRDALARRAALSPSAAAAASARASGHAMAWIGSQPGIVALFMSIGDEIDTRPLIERLAREGIQLALPVMVRRGTPLIFRRWAPGEPLEARVWGIREPLDTAESVMPDTLFVPLAAFDGRGGRIGYGAGHYDASLHAIRTQKPIRACGYAYAVQEVPEVPMEAHDQFLDAIVTERGVRLVRSG
jgi:5-formyltetrahydrofolate cyclo-ligase